MSGYVLGIDGGGTKTQAIILDAAGHYIGSGIAGSSNFNNIGVEAATANIGEAVNMVRQGAGIDETTFDATFLGIAGVVSEEDRAIVRSMAESLKLAPAKRTGVDHDCRIALAGGLAGAPGIVQIIGTGTSCFGINAAGDGWLAGGWGYLIADEGSGYWLGIEALKAAIAAYDTRGPDTTLLPAVMAALGINNMEEIMQRLYVARMSVTEIAALSRLIIEAARHDDSVAAGIIASGANEIARSVEAVARYLHFDEDVRLVLIGGITQAGEVVTEPLRQAIHTRLPHCSIEKPQFSAAIGAGLLAHQMLQPDMDPAFLQTLRTSVKRQT